MAPLAAPLITTTCCCWPTAAAARCTLQCTDAL
jgi:hypothetical protein